MRLLLDMNLSPAWVDVLERAGHSAVHWSSVGAADTPDTFIMEWARENRRVVFPHDLDYGAILFATGALSPSVIQIRHEDVRPAVVGELVTTSIVRAESELLSGALVTIDPRKTRITVLPLKKNVP